MENKYDIPSEGKEEEQCDRNYVRNENIMKYYTLGPNLDDGNTCEDDNISNELGVRNNWDNNENEDDNGKKVMKWMGSSIPPDIVASTKGYKVVREEPRTRVPTVEQQQHGVCLQEPNSLVRSRHCKDGDITDHFRKHQVIIKDILLITVCMSPLSSFLPKSSHTLKSLQFGYYPPLASNLNLIL